MINTFNRIDNSNRVFDHVVQVFQTQTNPFNKSVHGALSDLKVCAQK